MSEKLEEFAKFLEKHQQDEKDFLAELLDRKEEKPEKKHGDMCFVDACPRIILNGGTASFGEKNCSITGNIFDLMEHAGINGKIIALSVEELVMIITSNTDTALNLIKSKL